MSRSEFETAFDEWRAGRYPDYPRTEELRDWNSNLLTFDSYIAGYATRVREGSLRAGEVPDVDSDVADIGSLRASLEELKPSTDEDQGLIGEYRTYVAGLERMVVALGRLARSNRGKYADPVESLGEFGWADG